MYKIQKTQYIINKYDRFYKKYCPFTLVLKLVPEKNGLLIFSNVYNYFQLFPVYIRLVPIKPVINRLHNNCLSKHIIDTF